MKYFIPTLFLFLLPFATFAIGPITGNSTVCVNNTTHLNDTAAGGTWSSGNTSIASVDASGNVTGISTGTTTITYTVGASMATLSVIVPPRLTNITGPSYLCYGTTQLFTDSTGGGVWSSSNSAIATIGSVSGVVTALSQGAAIISYTRSGCYSVLPVTVSDPPATLWGCDNIGAGDSIMFEGTMGNPLQSSDNSVAAFNFSNGYIDGVAPGTATISVFNPSTGCLAAARNITVTPATLIRPISGSLPVCVGNTATLTDPVAGGAWSSSNPSIASINTSGVATGISGGSIMISYSVAGATCTIPFFVNSKPHPATGPTSVCAGDTITLTASTGSSRLGTTIVGIDWYGLGPTFIDGPPDGLTFSSSDTNKAKIVFSCYPCDFAMIKGIAGGSAIISYADVYTGCVTSTAITVNTTPVIPAITGGTSVCVTGTLTLGNTLAGGTWSSSNPSIATINSTTGFVTGVAIGVDTIIYAATNSCGTSTRSIVFNVSGTPPPMPASITGPAAVCAGALINMHDVTPGGVWSSGVPGIATINSATGAVTGIFPGSTPILYTVTNSCGSNFVSVPVSVNPVPTAITGTTNICVGSVTTLHNTVTGGSWTSGAVWIANIVPGSGLMTGVGAGTAVITYTAGTAACMVTANVTVNPVPSIYNVYGGGSYCSGGSGVPVYLSGSATGVNYQLYRYGTATGLPAAGTGTVLNFGLKTVAGVYTAVAVNAATGCSSNMTANATVIVNPLPSVFSVSGGGSYCAGGTGYHIYLVGAQMGTNYQLYNGPSPVGGIVAGTGASLNFGLFSATGTYTVVAITAATGCTTNMAGSATITINPNPTVYLVTGGGSYCSGSTGPHVGLDSSNTGIKYQLYRTGSMLGGPVTGINAPLDFGIETVAGAYTVKATNIITGCSSNMTGVAIISVNPLPAVYTVSGGGSYCAGGSGFQILLSDSHTGIRYQLYRDTTATGGLISGTDSAIAFGLQTAAGTYKVKAIDSVTGCIRNMTGTGVISINPAPTAFNMTGGGSYCAGGTGVYIGIDGSQAGVHYQLYYGAVAIGIPAIGTGGTEYFGSETGAGTYTAVATDPLTTCNNNMTGSETVSISPAPSLITGIDTLTIGGTTLLSDSISGGIWTASNLNATVDPSSGLVHGDSLGRDTITYTLSSGCAVTISVTVFPTVVSGVKALSQGGVLSVFPNPASDRLNIKWEGLTISENATVLVTDMAGREIYRSTVTIDNSGQAQIALDGMADGVYLITVRSEQVFYSGKVLIRR